MHVHILMLKEQSDLNDSGNSCPVFVGEGGGVFNGGLMMGQQLLGCPPCSLPAGPVHEPAPPAQQMARPALC